MIRVRLEFTCDHRGCAATAEGYGRVTLEGDVALLIDAASEPGWKTVGHLFSGRKMYCPAHAEEGLDGCLLTTEYGPKR